MSRLCRYGLRVILLLSLAACQIDKLVAPVTIEGAIRFDPPAIYSEWWSELSDCAQTSAQYSRVTWYRVPGYSFWDGRHEVLGVTLERWNIYLADGYLNVEPIVKHEMLHALGFDSSWHNGWPFSTADNWNCEYTD